MQTAGEGPIMGPVAGDGVDGGPVFQIQDGDEA
jgi:hypothetical protein